jgi:hypothetical protein
MYGINYNGLKRRELYDDIVRYIETDPNKIKYPNRQASFIEQSHYMKMLGGEDYMAMEEQQNKVIKGQVKNSIIKKLATKGDATHSLLRASTEEAVGENEGAAAAAASDALEAAREEYAQAVDEAVRKSREKKHEKRARNVQLVAESLGEATQAKPAAAFAEAVNDNPEDERPKGGEEDQKAHQRKEVHHYLNQ